MKALVTGATGFIGSHVVDKLIELGFEIKCIVRPSSNLQWLKEKPVQIIEGSFDDKEFLMNAVENVDYVFHIAGLTYGRNLDEFMRGNRDVTKLLIEACLTKMVKLKKFLFVSSQTVTGPAKSLEEPVDENTTCNPITSYGKSKKTAEEEVLNVRDKIPVTIIRASAVYGPRDTAIYDVFKTIKMGLGTMVGLKPKYVSLVHSEDLSRGIVEAAISEKTNGEIYFISSEKIYTWNYLIPLIAKTLGKKYIIKLKLPHFVVLFVAWISGFLGKFSSKPPVFNYEKGVDFIQNYWICSVNKAKNDFAYSQKISIEEGMRITVDWYKNHGWL